MSGVRMQQAAENRLTGDPDASPAISIVVIGRNEGQRLGACLESIRRIRDVAVKDLIYVDSASNDGSPELALRYGATVIVVPSERPTAAMGRNSGWFRATSGLILFLDGDTVLDPGFALAACNALARQPSVAAVWGHRRELRPEASIYNRILDLDWVYPPGLSDFCGGDVLMRRNVLLETGGFDERLIAGEEPELCRRIRSQGYGILHIDCPMTGHDLQITRWSQYWRRATRAGHAYAEVSERFRNSDDPFWSSDRRRNLMRGSWWIVSLAGAVAAAASFGFLPIALWLVMLLFLSMRSAWKARWKNATPGILLLYGFHSHLQQIPILVGQLQYELSKRRKRARKLIEYKERRAD
jgi:glycosyltransferase involved in cell wall biosynthesis